MISAHAEYAFTARSPDPEPPLDFGNDSGSFLGSFSLVSLCVLLLGALRRRLSSGRRPA